MRNPQPYHAVRTDPKTVENRGKIDIPNTWINIAARP